MSKTTKTLFRFSVHDVEKERLYSINSLYGVHDCTCLAGWLAGCCWLTEVSWLTLTCFEAALFRCGVCWQLRIFLALPYIYSLDRPIRSQHFQCPCWPIRSQDCEWQNSGFWLVSLCIKVWATLGQCPSLCSTLKGRTSISNNLEWIRAIWWQFQEAPWVGKAGNSNF